MKKLLLRICPHLGRYYLSAMLVLLLMFSFSIQAFAVEDMWTVANRIIVDVYEHIAGISTVLAGLMSAVAVIGAKMSNNQHKVDQAWIGCAASGSPGRLSTGLGLSLATSFPSSRVLQPLTLGYNVQFLKIKNSK